MAVRFFSQDGFCQCFNVTTESKLGYQHSQLEELHTLAFKRMFKAERMTPIVAQILIGLNNKYPESDTEVNSERSEK